MDVLKIGKRRIVTARIVSQYLWVIGTHWSDRLRRTMLCPGAATCPACELQALKPRGYAVADLKTKPGDTSGSERGLIELCSEVIDQLRQRGLRDEEAAGWAWRMERREDRPGWKVLAADQRQDCEAVDPWTLPTALEKLYGLPPVLHQRLPAPVPRTELETFLADHARCLTARLRAAQQMEDAR